MTTQAPPMDQTKVEAKQAFKESSIALLKFLEKLYPVSVVISAFVGILVVIFSSLYFVVNLRIAPIESEISGIKTRIAGIESQIAEIKTEITGVKVEIKEMDRKQEERHNQLLQYLLQQQKPNK